MIGFAAGTLFEDPHAAVVREHFPPLLPRESGSKLSPVRSSTIVIENAKLPLRSGSLDIHLFVFQLIVANGGTLAVFPGLRERPGAKGATACVKSGKGKYCTERNYTSLYREGLWRPTRRRAAYDL
jgi:hypothetical protein